MGNQVTVYVVDDDDHARVSLSELLQACGFEVRAYSCPSCFLKQLDPNEQACLVLDLRMPKLDGIEVQEQLLDRRQCIPTVLVTAHGDVPSTVRAMKLGILDVLEKPYEPRVLLERVRAACALARQRDDYHVECGRLRAAVSRLSRREREVCKMLIQGLTPKEIAFRLNISHRTAQLHRERILQKLDLRGVADLCRRADVIRLGLWEERAGEGALPRDRVPVQDPAIAS